MKLNEHWAAWVDVASISVLLGWWLEVAPAVATTFTAIWAVIRVFETKTVQRWLGR